MAKFSDKLWQWGLWAAYRLLRCYWFIYRPASHGACVVLWHAGRVLLIENSYKSEYTIPGGSVKKGESPAEAAARELFEETGIQVQPENLNFVGDFMYPGEFKKDRGSLFEIEMDTEPAIRIDNREVIRADFRTPDQALQEELFQILRDHLVKTVNSGNISPLPES